MRITTTSTPLNVFNSAVASWNTQLAASCDLIDDLVFAHQECYCYWEGLGGRTCEHCEDVAPIAELFAQLDVTMSDTAAFLRRAVPALIVLHGLICDPTYPQWLNDHIAKHDVDH